MLIVAISCLPSCKEEKHYHDYFDQSQLDVIATIGKQRPKLQDRHLDYDTSWMDETGAHHLLVNHPSIRVFSNESTLRMRWLKYWSFSLASFLPKKSQG